MAVSFPDAAAAGRGPATSTNLALKENEGHGLAGKDDRDKSQPKKEGFS
jgi:hypothetical protein